MHCQLHLIAGMGRGVRADCADYDAVLPKYSGLPNRLRVLPVFMLGC